MSNKQLIDFSDVPALEIASLLYRQLLIENRPTSARVVQFRTFLVTQFTEGNKIAMTIDRELRESRQSGQVAMQPTTLKTFVHPQKGQPIQRKPTVNSPRDERRSKFKDVPTGAETDELGLPTALTENPPIKHSTPPKQTPGQPDQTDEKKVAELAADSPLNVSIPAQPHEIERLLGFSRNDIAGVYDKQQLIAFCETHGIDYNETASVKQIAGAILQHYKDLNKK